MKVIKNQCIHRLMHCKIILVVYFAFFCTICLELQWLSGFTKNPYESNFSLLKELQSERIVGSFYIFVCVILTVFIFYMYKDYRSGRIRWMILTNQKGAQVIGDTLSVFLVIIVLYVIAWVGVYFVSMAKLEILMRTKIPLGSNVNLILKYMKQIPEVTALYPSSLSGMIANIGGLLFISQVGVCLCAFLVKRKQRYLDMAYIVIAVVILYVMVGMNQAYVQIALYAIWIYVYFYMAQRARKDIGGRKHHVKN